MPGCFLCSSSPLAIPTVTEYVEVPWASPSLISRPRGEPRSLLVDVNFILCFTVTCYKVVSAQSWEPGPSLLDSLGPDPRPACTLTVSALSHALGYSKPPMLRTGQLRNPQEPLRMRLDSAKAKFRLLKVFGASSLRLWGLGWGCGDGDGKHVQSTL